MFVISMRPYIKYMEINKKTLLLDSIEQIGNLLKLSCKDQQSFLAKLESYKEDLLPIMEYLNCDETQGFIDFFIEIKH